MESEPKTIQNDESSLMQAGPEASNVSSEMDSMLSDHSGTFIREITTDLFYRATSRVGDHKEIEDATQLTQTLSGLQTTQDILDNILKGAEYNIELREQYDLKCRSHNQYGLFNLLDHITKFNMNDSMYDALTFRECLLISKIEPHEEDKLMYRTTPVGGLCIDIQKAEGKQPQERLMEEYETKLMKFLDHEGISDHISGGSDIPKPGTPTMSEDNLSAQNDYGYSKFVVHVSSQFDVDGRNGGSSITSWVDRNCHTIEELRKEFIMNGENVNEKSLYMALKRRWYYVKHTSSQESIDDRKLYSIRKARDYVSEGASFILMRYLAIIRYYGRIELAAAYINGDLCRNIYVTECLGPQSSVFHGTRIDCCRIRRTIIEQCGLERCSVTLLTLQGRILKQEWDNCDYILLINPQTKIKDTKPSCLDEKNWDLAWTEDMQLMSAYLNFKERCLMEAKTYDADHPELRQLMADYINQILRLRPPDVKSFTINYFGSFVSTHLPRNEYFE